MDEAHPLMAKMNALGLDAYLRKDTSAVAGLPGEALRSGARGLFLSAPASLDSGATRAVPALLLLVRSEARTESYPFPQNAAAVAIDLDRGATYVAPAFAPDVTKRPDLIAGVEETPPPKAPPPPARTPQEQQLLDQAGHGMSASFIWFDFGKLLNLPRRNAHYLLRVIEFDTLSNAAPVRVQSAADAVETGVAPEAALALADQLREQAKSGSGPRYQRNAKTPVLTGPGVALSLDVPSTVEGRRHVWARGAIRLELTPSMLVGAATGNANPALRPPRAVLKASVLVMMKGEPNPMHLNLDIPLQSEHALRAGELAEAAFEVDLASVMPAQPPAGVYQVYLLSGPHLAGPIPLTLPGG